MQTRQRHCSARGMVLCEKVNKDLLQGSGMRPTHTSIRCGSRSAGPRTATGYLNDLVQRGFFTARPSCTHLDPVRVALQQVFEL